MSHLEQLKAHKFFEGMDEGLLARIDACCTTEVSWEGEQVIFSEGQSADICYLILEGDVSLEVHSPGGGVRTISTLHGGDVLGWSWMFPPYRWSFDARTMTPAEALALDGSKLRDLKAGDHELGYELMSRVSQVLINRLQATRLQLLDLYEHGR